MSRNSLAVRIGRLYQRVSPLFTKVDDLTFLSRTHHHQSCPKIIILACPRSGSTLTYQVLTSGIQNFHLVNLWNLLYATPYIGGVLTKKKSENYQSNFRSNHGFVEGLWGEAEGLQFWEYWTGQGLHQEGKWNKKQAAKLSRKIDVLGQADCAFITGFLGHVFCIKELQELFPNAIFVHLTRNILPNALSIYRASPKDFFSCKPSTMLQEMPNGRAVQIVKQLFDIQRTILKDIDTERRIVVAYENLCRNPLQEIKRIINFGNQKGQALKLRRNQNIPIRFSFKQAENNFFTEKLKSEIARTFEQCTAEEQVFFKPLI